MGHPVPPSRARELAALLTAGPGAALSHVTAGHVYAIFRAEPPVVHVTVPSSTRARSRDGLVIHRAETQLLRLLRRIGASAQSRPR